MTTNALVHVHIPTSGIVKVSVIIIKAPLRFDSVVHQAVSMGEPTLIGLAIAFNEVYWDLIMVLDTVEMQAIIYSCCC